VQHWPLAANTVLLLLLLLLHSYTVLTADCPPKAVQLPKAECKLPQQSPGCHQNAPWASVVSQPHYTERPSLSQ
jgi:hypothetical protein